VAAVSSDLESSGVGSQARRPFVPLVALHRRWPHAAWWLPIGLAGVYGLVVLAHLRGITASMYANADYAAAPVIAHALAGVPAGTSVVIGQSKWYEPLTFLWATDWLPLHRQIWDVTPLLCDFVALAALLWSARRAFGLWAAALVGAAVVCFSEGGIEVFVGFDSHGATALHAIVLGVALTWLAPLDPVISWRRLVAGSIALGLFSAVAVPDRLFVVWGLLPFVAGAALIAWRASTPASLRVLAFAVATTAVALGAGGAFEAIVQGHGINTAPVPLTLVAGGALVGQVIELLEGLTALAGGDFFGFPVNFVGIATFASGMLVFAALAAVLVEVRRRARLAAPRAAGRGSGAVTPHLAYVSFWSTSLISSLGAFTFGSFGGNAGGGRYLLGAYIAIAALLPLLAERGYGHRLSLTVAVSLFALLATYQLVRAPVNSQLRSPSTSEVNALARFASAHDLRYGYAGYWDSLPVSWQTAFRLQVFPVAQCAPTAQTLCPFSTVHVSSWYRPRAHTPTFLIVDPTEPFVGAPDPAFGRPVETAVIGHLEISVYGYDIASRFGDRYAP
jgi:hypothetical protein